MKEELWESVRSKFSKYFEIPTVSGVRVHTWNDRTQNKNNWYSKEKKKEKKIKE